MLDFQEVKQKYSIEDVAKALGLQLSASNGESLRGPCPSKEGDERSLVVTPSKGLWYSFAKQGGGDTISLVSFVKDTSAKEAARWIVDNLGGGNTTEEPTEKEPGTGLKELDYLQSDHPAVQALGFEVEDAERLGIGWSNKGIMRGYIAIPIRLPSGHIAGYLGIHECKLPPKWRID